jgi:hypothetical protein
MASRVHIHDPQGSRLAELQADVSRSWVLNGIGRATFTLPIKDSKLTQTIIRDGNLIYVEHDKLPAWGGVIVTPIDWSINEIAVECQTPEILLQRRVCKEKIIGEPSGDIFRTFIEWVASPVVRIERTDSNQSSSIRNVEYVWIYNKLVELQTKTLQDWHFDPRIEDQGQLYFAASWLNALGVLADLTLEEGLNLELPGGVIVSEQGEIWNNIITYWEANRNVAEAGSIEVSDPESINRHGLRQLPVQVGNDSPENARNLLAYYKNPRRSYNLIALDQGDTFSRLQIGNVFKLKLVSSGFSEAGIGLDVKVRIVAMEYDDISNSVALVVREYNEDLINL